MPTQTGSYDFKAAKAVQDNLDGMVIGGRNLLKGSMTLAVSETGKCGWMYNSQTPEIVTKDGYRCLHASASLGPSWTPSIRTRNRVLLEWGQEYRYSGYIMYDKAIKTASSAPLHYHVGSVETLDEFNLGINSKGGGVNVTMIEPGANVTIPANTWQRYVYKVWTNDSAPNASYPYPTIAPFIYGNLRTVSETATVNMWARDIQIEKGSKVTDWTPAPEDVNANIAALQPFIIGTQTAATRFWTGNCPELLSLKDGQQITYWLPYAYKNETAQSKGITAAELVPAETITTAYSYDWLKLTLADGEDSGWIPIYYGGTTRLTSHYGAANAIHLTYREGYSSAIPKGWWCDANYVDGNTTFTRYSDTVISGLNGLKRYTLCMADKNGRWTSIVNQANNYAKTGKTCYTGGLKLGKVLYHSTGGDYAAGAASGQLWESYGGLDFRYSVNGVENASTTELQLRKPVYLVGTIHSDGLFYLDTTKWWTQTEPTTADGKVYVLVGSAYSSVYAIFLSAENPAYIYHDGEFKTYEQYQSDEAAKVAGNYIVSTASNDVWIHTEDHGPNDSGAATTNTYGWRIGSVFELVRAGLSYLKMEVVNSIAKVRVGLENAGHSIFSPDGMEVFTDASTSVAKFGSTVQIGKRSANIEIEDIGLTSWVEDEKLFSVGLYGPSNSIYDNGSPELNYMFGAFLVDWDGNISTNVTNPSLGNSSHPYCGFFYSINGVTVGSAPKFTDTTALGSMTGTLGANHGGTGYTSLQATRNAMGLGNTTGALPVANGGTGITNFGEVQTQNGSNNAGAVASLSTSGSAGILCSKSLGAGDWLVIGYAWFASNTTGRRAVKLSTDSKDVNPGIGCMITAPASGTNTELCVMRHFTLTATTPIHLNGYQNSGASLNVGCYITAIRLG